MPGQSPSMTTRKISGLKAQTCLRSSSKSLQQPIDVVELDFRTEALAGAAAQFVQNLAGFLQGILVGNFDVALIIGAVVRHRPAERVALDAVARLSVGGADLVIPGVAPLALHPALHLLGEIARRLLQLVERLGLRTDRLAGLAVAAMPRWRRASPARRGPAAPGYRPARRRAGASSHRACGAALPAARRRRPFARRGPADPRPAAARAGPSGPAGLVPCWPC